MIKHLRNKLFSDYTKSLKRSVEVTKLSKTPKKTSELFRAS